MGTVIFIAIVVLLIFLFRAKRKHEENQFRDASYADFVDFDSKKKPSDHDSDSDIEKITELAESAIRLTKNGAGQVSPSLESASLEMQREDPKALVPEPYRAREYLFDDLTGSILKNLSALVGHSHLLLCRVSLNDLVRTRDSEGVAADLVTLKIDFVLCRKSDLKVDYAIFIDRGKTSRVRDVLQAAGIAHTVIKPGEALSAGELKSLLGNVIEDSQKVRQCDECANPMKVKLLKREKQGDGYYWVCEHCKVTRLVR